MSRAEQPIAVVAKLTGVSTDTIRAWERRYRLITPERDPGGNRRYSDRDVRRIVLAQKATALGHPIGSLARLSDVELERLIDRHTQPHAEPIAASADESTVDAALSAIAAFDVPRASAVLHAAALLMEPQEFVLGLLAPLMRRVGDAWSSGDMSIVQEHVATNLVRDLIGSFRRTRASTSRVNVLFATPPEELHDIGLGLAACLVAMHGAQTVFLGAQVPADELVTAASRLNARVVVVSSIVEQLGAWEAYVRILDAHLPPRTALWIGGSGAQRLHNVLPGRISRFGTLEAFSQYVEEHRDLWLR